MADIGRLADLAIRKQIDAKKDHEEILDEAERFSLFTEFANIINEQDLEFSTEDQIYISLEENCISIDLTETEIQMILEGDV